MASRKLAVFISSSLTELRSERLAVRDAVHALRMEPWLWELDAGARPESPRRAFLQEVSNADVFVGIFGSAAGEYTLQEYERARAERKPCFVYFKSSTDVERTPDLKQLFDDHRSAQSDHTAAEFEGPAQLRSQVTADLERWRTEVVRGTGERRSTGDDELVDWSVETIRAHVQRYEIEEHLERVTAATPLFDVPVTVREAHHARSVNPHSDRRDRAMTADEFVAMYAANPSQVTMIIGAAGHGKSLLMTRLVQRALLRSRSIAPAVVSLVSWRRGADLQAWLIKTLAEDYRIGVEGSTAVLKDRRVELFLDGLDEVPHDQREELGQAVRAYFTATAVRRAVMCCRSDAYDVIGSRLDVDLLVTVEAMSTTQVERALAHLPAGWPAAPAGSAVADRLTTPLLLNVASRMDASQVQALVGGDTGSGQAVQRRILEAFLQSTLSHRSADRKLDTAVLTHSLSWLARLTTHRGYLELERMQPAWLRRMSDRVLYVLISRVFSGMLTGAALALATLFALSALDASIDDNWRDLGMYVAMAGAISSVLLLACDSIWLVYARWAPEQLGSKTIMRLVKMLGPGLVIAIGSIWFGAESILVIPVVLASAVLSAVRSHGLDGDIRPRARFGFTWGRVAAVELALGIAYAAVMAAIVTVGFRDWNPPGVGRFADPGRTIWTALGIWLLRGMWIALAFGLPFAMSFASRARTIETTHFPNEGIWNALKAAAFSLIIVGSVTAIAAGLFIDGWTVPVAIGSCFGVVVAFWSGGVDVFEHWLVRALMFADSGVPVRPVLYWGQEAGILRMSGGRCAFAHALLEECAVGLSTSVEAASPRSMPWIRNGLWVIGLGGLTGMALILWMFE